MAASCSAAASCERGGLRGLERILSHQQLHQRQIVAGELGHELLRRRH